MTREQIIDLINQYIYTNGRQSITASQLREILLDIANAFAMEGGGATGGIDAVLEAGDEVTSGRRIANEDGGTVLFAEDYTGENRSYKYMGLDISVPQNQSFSYLLDTQVTIGNLKRNDPSRNIFNMSSEPLLLEGEVFAATSYLSESPVESFKPGIFSTVVDDTGRSRQHLSAAQVKTSVTYGEGDDMGSRQTMDTDAIGQMVTGAESFTAINMDPAGAFINTEQTEEIYTQMYAVQGETGNRTANGLAITDHILHPDSISAAVSNGPKNSRHTQELEKVSTHVVDGSKTFESAVYSNKQSWISDSGPITDISNTGIKLMEGKTLEFASSDPAGNLSLEFEDSNAFIKVAGSELTKLGFQANYIRFIDGITVYGSFSASNSTLLTPFSVTSATFSTAFSSTHSTPGGNNIAVYASAINGVTNTAVFAESGNVVIKNGSAMIGFDDMDMTPDARLDIQAQGGESLAIRVRNVENSANVMEVRSDGNVLMGSVSSPSGGNVLHIANGEAPDTSSEDAAMIYSDALEEDGNVVPHFLTGNGQLIRLYQQKNDIGDALYSSKKGVPLSDTDTYDGFTLKQVVKALINLGILAK